MKLAKYIRITEKLSQSESQDLEDIQHQALESISSSAVIDEYVSEILGLFYKAFQFDSLIFIEQVFFENQLMIRRTAANQEYVLDWFEQTKALPDGNKKQIQMVHVYRAIVSDIFEPYLSILVACIHLVEGTFDTFLQANLGAGEFNKFEFITKRLKGTNLMRGYFPIIRNAISHAGSHGIQYGQDHILFKKIKREKKPTVSDVLSVTNSELLGHIQALLDFTQCVDVSVNIFGIDANDVIIKTPKLAQVFFERMFTPDSHAKYQAIRAEEYQKIWINEKMTTAEKHEHFAGLFAKVCQKYAMPATTLRFLEKESIVLVTVPAKKIDLTDNNQVIYRISELIRYCVLAYQYFHFKFDSFLTEEHEKNVKDALQVWIKKEELKQYHQGQASYLDLIHDGNIYKNRQDWAITVDFDALKELDQKSLANVKKRKQRP